MCASSSLWEALGAPARWPGGLRSGGLEAVLSGSWTRGQGRQSLCSVSMCWSGRTTRSGPAWVPAQLALGVWPR
eukprot:11172516-Lingulodinium_polyedra.AAC.1